MRSKVIPIVVVLLVVAGVIAPGAGSGTLAAQAQPASIRLKAATFSPARGEAPTIPPGLTIANYAEGQRGYYIVQFAGPVEQAWKDQVAAEGAEILDYIPVFAFKVRMNPAEARRIERLANVAAVTIFQPAFKLSPDLRRSGTNLYRVSIERGADVGLAQAAIALTGAQAMPHGNTLLVAADGGQLDAIAHVLDVAWIDNYVLWEKHNEYGGGDIIGATVANNRGVGYNGSSQIAAVADTGIGGGTAATAHRDIPSSRIVAIQDFPGVPDSCFQTIYPDGSIDVDSGHGTHVAGSVLSGGDPGRFGKGVAPAASLVFQSTENYVAVSTLCRAFYGYTNGYYLTGLNDLYKLFSDAYGAGARIHANSWGSAQAGAYTANSATTDEFVWNKKDMTITFSAGNSGVDTNNNGEVDNDSIGAPATAKNVITIGASENDRQGNYQCDTTLTYTSRDSTYQSGQTCGSMGGNNVLGTPRQRWGFTANPVADDPSAGNKEQMAAFSSRGPTDDGRIKPDVVAPGTWILSTYSSQYREGYGTATNPRTGAFQSDGWGMPRNGYYKYFGGTSMSNPIAAGAATIVRDFYNKAHRTEATAALVKATLINSAVDLLDENNDGANDNDYPIPNAHEGWGRIDLDNATDGSAQFVDHSAGLVTGATSTHSFGASAGPVKFTLVWSDYQSTTSAAKNLVNDLDLEVTSPTGTVYRGNVLGGGWSQSGGIADHTNNVENVYVQSATSGTWTVQVRGYNVPNGPQPFALVVDGAASQDTGTTPTATPVTPTPTPLPSTTVHVSDLDGSSATSSKNAWKATVAITVHDANDQVVANALVSDNWSGGYSSTASCTTNALGICSVTTGNISTKKTNATFTVGGISASGYTYRASDNQDADGDGNGTAITVTKP